LIDSLERLGLEITHNWCVHSVL